ncbi:MAG: 50S ribosomal protein L19 [Bdellovibrio sp. CG12_big_fil_rev_8_21_14_0_65_39_13]|nr:MAG: 50S ribosomal protein L19 [Bdellovibrio sp. CG22_combo_CG10-13_8_21_14_all_39_27]PIQ59926.1 MAG: 50S ribosomal protein L19 [Bdellovibrio sp. CG12_big_fil_rev_8_21_14_0_65_39_13]PIR34440.1 MAG: 50S ribosomal protein L19 [Bdellovibrio sp. CG11_big_fil_rev_8_21_14_0_20_39_38]PJB53864.1 MAG: 50S ribosomal protein L19 [Bdellovibrio sp. CG_4_9_14_3_um_filter_39_7]
MNLIDVVNQDHLNPNVKNLPHFRTGDTISVHARISEGGKSRIQTFQGVVISIKSRGNMDGAFTVRKISSGMGVERTFPFHSPKVEKVEVVQRGKSRRSKLYYLRERSGKSARIEIDYGTQEQDKK